MRRWRRKRGVIKVKIQLHVVGVEWSRIWLRLLNLRLGLRLRILLLLRVLRKLLVLSMLLLRMMLRLLLGLEVVRECLVR